MAGDEAGRGDVEAGHPVVAVAHRPGVDRVVGGPAAGLGDDLVGGGRGRER